WEDLADELRPCLLRGPRAGLRASGRHARSRSARQRHALRRRRPLERGPIPLRVAVAEHALHRMGARRAARRDDRRGTGRLERGRRVAGQRVERAEVIPGGLLIAGAFLLRSPGPVLEEVERGGVRWKFAAAEAAAVARWEPVLRRFLGKAAAPRIAVGIFPDPPPKGREAGSQ